MFLYISNKEDGPECASSSVVSHLCLNFLNHKKTQVCYKHSCPHSSFNMVVIFFNLTGNLGLTFAPSEYLSVNHRCAVHSEQVLQSNRATCNFDV